MTARPDHLETQGYDVRAIRAGIECGDGTTSRSLMQQFMKGHTIETPSPEQNDDRITAHLDHLEELGYDVHAIRAGIECGDGTTSRSLMQQFNRRAQRRDLFTARQGKKTRGIPLRGRSRTP